MTHPIGRRRSPPRAQFANIRTLKRLYGVARTLEQRCGYEPCKEAAREIAVLALDMLAEARAGR